MICYREHCIYQQDDKCLLNEIIVDETGMCSCCICADIDKETLIKAKAETLANISH